MDEMVTEFISAVEHNTESGLSIIPEHLCKHVVDILENKPIKEKWILCSEESPTDEDYGEEFLATIQCEHVDGWDDYITGVAEWSANGWDIMSGYVGQIKVVAWQRMPAPCKSVIAKENI